MEEPAGPLHHPIAHGGKPPLRAETLLSTVTVSLADLLLDPGDELTLTDDPAVSAEASFMRAFVPVRSYRRLLEADLDGLASAIARDPVIITDRILVRSMPDLHGQFVVIDGSRHVAALRFLAETGSANGVGLSLDVVALFGRCPVTIVHPGTDPAFVLALMGDGSEHDADPWLHGQRNHQLHLLAREGVHHSQPTLAAAAGGDTQVIRRYHAYRALGQMMQEDDVPLHMAVHLYPLFHAAVGRSAIRTWLDWDDTMCRFMDDAQVERFYELVQPTVQADGTTRPPCIASVNDIVELCDVLSEPAARAELLEHHRTLDEAMEVINAGAFHEWTAHIGDAYENMVWNRRRFGRQT